MKVHATNVLARLVSVFLTVMVLAAAGYSQTPSTETVERVTREILPPASVSPDSIVDASRQRGTPEITLGRRFPHSQSARRFAAQNNPEGASLTESTKDRPAKIGRSTGRWVIPDGATEWGFEVGAAWDAAIWMSGPKYYDLEDRGHIVGSLRWGKVLGTRAFVTYSWAIELMPLNVALGNEVDNPRYIAGAVNEPRRNREATHGIGINPASFRFIFFPQYRLRPQVGAGFGITHHFKRMPTVEGTKMNFQADFQIGGQYMVKENKALNFGYRYFHSSNLYIFDFNPGYNMNMWFVGYSIFK